MAQSSKSAGQVQRFMRFNGGAAAASSLDAKHMKPNLWTLGAPHMRQRCTRGAWCEAHEVGCLGAWCVSTEAVLWPMCLVRNTRGQPYRRLVRIK